jgi:glyoxylase-like metal-dependent hydrolase (beta-lactamase superfamily II)
MKLLKKSLLALALLAGAGQAAAAPDVRLYRLDCGTMHIGDMSMMSDAGHYQGRSYDIVISCYLIKHGDDWLLWDTGYPRAFQGGVTQGKLHMRLDRTIVDQIATLGLTPADIGQVVLSHAHFDHAGQSNDFPQSTLVIQRAEHAVLADRKEAEAHFIQPALLEAHTAGAHPKLRLLDGDTDLFGDGTVRLYALPGHTPGHMALELTLARAGKVVLSGDQWHFTENHEGDQVPTFNYDHAQTIASSKRLDAIITRDHARLVIGHEPKDNAGLPALPRYLD